MKVEGPRTPRPTTTTGSRPVTAAGLSGEFARVLGAAPQPTGTPATPVRTVSAAEALFAIQEVGDATERSRRARRRAHEVLDRLQALHRGLIEGRLGLGEIQDLIRVVASERDQVDDPALAALLDEIDLRAQVEVAKLETALQESRES
ncbi:MAG: flagellar assembly protein FliX [Alphaproteobacteria bacterium]|nr:flagellar assembly protein FliX [Alphaproteobacteria bacterium]